MNHELKLIIDEYLENVAKLCTVMLKELGLKTKRELLLYLRENKIWELSIQGINYQFHGRGCYARYDGKYINWDFGYRSRWCGIDPWFIAITLQENGSKYSEYFDGKMIQEECEKAVQNNEMFLIYGQYYFVIPMNETFKPDFPDEFDSLIIEYFGSQWEVKRNKVINRFIRKSTWVYKGIENIKDKYILRFMSNGKEIYSIPYCDIGYPENAIKIMSDDIINNLMRAEINMK